MAFPHFDLHVTSVSLVPLHQTSPRTRVPLLLCHPRLCSLGEPWPVLGARPTRSIPRAATTAAVGFVPLQLSRERAQRQCPGRTVAYSCAQCQPGSRALHSVVGLKVQRAVTQGTECESTFICVLTCALTQNCSVIFKACGTLICPRCWPFGQFPVVAGTDMIPGGKGFLCRPTASGSGSRLGGVILGCM